MELTLNTTGLVLDIIGCILLFCESFKMRIFYEKKEASLRLAQGRNNWAWRNIDRIGLGFLFIGFLLQVIYSLKCT